MDSHKDNRVPFRNVKTYSHTHTLLVCLGRTMQDPLHNDSEPTHVFSTSSPLSCTCLKDRSWHHTTAKDSGLIFLVFLILFVSAPLHPIWDVSERLLFHTHLAVSQPRELFSHAKLDQIKLSEWNAGAQSSFKQHFEDFWRITFKKNNNTKIN